MGLFSGNSSKRDLEERVEMLERKQRALENEWISWYEKAQKMLWRLVKRAEVRGGIGDDEEGGDRPTQGQPDAISAKILARRKARGVLPG